APFGVEGSPTSMPSINTLVWLELVPRMKTEVSPPGPPVWTTFKPGAVFSASGTVRYCWVWMSLSVMIVTELATCPAGVTTPVGLTATGAAVVGAPAAGAAGGCFGVRETLRGRFACCVGEDGCTVAGRRSGGETSTGGNRLGEADCCACAAGISQE